MVDVLNLYLDDSGTRHPDRKPNERTHGHDWFGLAGVMVADDETNLDAVRERHSQLIAKWKLFDKDGDPIPLHSADIRNRTGGFRWLRSLDAERLREFFDDVGSLTTSPELIAIACVIDRPGYNARYREKYGRARWLLCKTAFTVVVERAVKHAIASRSKLRVLVERSDMETDRMMRAYYDDLRKNGHPFDESNAARYTPLTAAQFHDTLYEFRAKGKSSPLVQVADLVAWPICIGGYDPANIPYNVLKRAGTLIDSKLQPHELDERGIKYSCWELEHAKR